MKRAHGHIFIQNLLIKRGSLSEKYWYNKTVLQEILFEGV